MPVSSYTCIFKDIYTEKNMKKKFLTVIAVLGISVAATAQEGFTVIESDVNLKGIAISGNGNYVVGSTDEGPAFVYDVQNKEVKSSGLDAEARSVSDEGVAVGYDNVYPYIFKADGTSQKLETKGDYGIAETITTDGKIIAGSTDWDDAQYVTHASIWEDGKLTMLPEPTSDWLGFTNNGTAAKFISDDASVVVGWIIDDLATYPCMVWRKNVDGSYSALPLGRRFYEPADGNRPYWTFNATGLSRNGRYIALSVQAVDRSAVVLPARYDLWTDSLEVCGQSGLDEGVYYYSSNIADDGTLVGYSEDSNTRKGFIWKSGESSLTMLADEYPSISKLAVYDGYFHVPTDITPDGSKILGFGVNTETGIYETYVIDRDKFTTGIESAVSGNAASETAVARYTTDGKKIERPSRGINILQMSDGKSRKVLVK